ncbi:hypothetical protein QVD17_30320 [Tagetes erecta]|uniref:Uncharacterized protein n=1 Tax=Tagetes erecta TaxID=13708 RepID=A0AAD8NNB2_TARER|nr:hypothetical protein QVD17_30320 [Tagetes erecta]
MDESKRNINGSLIFLTHTPLKLTISHVVTLSSSPHQLESWTMKKLGGRMLVVKCSGSFAKILGIFLVTIYCYVEVDYVLYLMKYTDFVMFVGIL